MKTPQYVKTESGLALRKVKETYYNDAGSWAVGYRWTDGKLLVKCDWDNDFHNTELVECTEDFWRKTNIGYIETETEKIICSAIHYEDGIKRPHLPKNIDTGIVVAGWRHANSIQQLKVMFYDEYEENSKHNKKRIEVIRNQTQGFLTSTGRFVDRDYGAEIARNAEQVHSGVTELYSEDLY